MTELVAGTDSPAGRRTAGIRARLALEAGKMVSWEWNIESDEVTAGDGFFDLFGLKRQRITSKDVFAAMYQDDVAAVETEVEAAVSNDVDYVTEFRIVLPDGRHRWIGARGAVTARAPDGTALRMLGINWDKTDQKLQEERLSMMADEMNHRVENGFAIMAALVQIGARATDGKKRYAERLRSQVQALASAHRLSVAAARRPDDEDTLVDVKDVVSSALAAWAPGGEGCAEDESQVTTAFRTDAKLRPKQSAALAMLAYELATNALKYGALSTEDGHLTVALDAAPNGSAVLRWTERMDQSVVTQPASSEDGRGFGSVLIEHCSRMLRGTVVRTMTGSGLRIEVVFPVVRDAEEVRQEAVVEMATVRGRDPRLTAVGV